MQGRGTRSWWRAIRSIWMCFGPNRSLDLEKKASKTSTMPLQQLKASSRWLVTSSKNQTLQSHLSRLSLSLERSTSTRETRYSKTTSLSKEKGRASELGSVCRISHPSIHGRTPSWVGFRNHSIC